MGEHVSNGYQRLFEIRLLHHYWLDEGGTLFDLMPDQAKKEARLLRYDVRPLFIISPTTPTAKVLSGFGGLYKATALGCIVAVPNGAVIPADATFEFVVTVQGQDALNYTALTLRPQKIYELYYQSEDRVYRYKENVPVLSNATGVSRGTDPTKALFLSTEIPALAADDQVEALIVSGGALLQLTGDQPGAPTQQIGAMASDLPVFVHQGDVPVIAPPTGLTGAPLRGVLLSPDVPDEVFAIIQLSAVRASNGEFSLLNASGQANVPHRVFQVRFKNRSTVWQYMSKNTRAITSTEPNPRPLTYFGNPGTKQKPTEGLVKPVKSGAKITQLVSEIFV